MCFSATASFGASAVLLGAGIVIVKMVRNPKQIMFASIPILFSVQQFTEGFVWLSLKNAEFSSMQHFSSNLFLFFALVVWPIWVPFSILKIEEKIMRRKLLTVLTIIGGMTSLFLAYSLFFEGYEPVMLSHHIMYQHLAAIRYIPLGGIFYFIPTVLTPFISSHKRMKYFGLVMLASYIVSNLFYRNYIISVWCYFAAIMCAAVYILMFKINKTAKANELVL